MSRLPLSGHDRSPLGCELKLALLVAEPEWFDDYLPSASLHMSDDFRVHLEIFERLKRRRCPIPGGNTLRTRHPY